jgi:lipopolysaccharide export system protein LptC
MNSRLTHALPILLMLLLGGMTLWLQHAIQAPDVQRTDRARHEPDALVEQFTVTRLAADGRPEARVSASRMVHFADDDSTELTRPQLVKTDPGVTMTVRADRGVVTRDYEHAYFYDNVQLARSGDEAGEPLQLRTQFLHVMIREDLVRSDRPVTITRGQSSLSGVGLEYDRKAGRLTLLSSVKASFDAQRR